MSEDTWRMIVPCPTCQSTKYWMGDKTKVLRSIEDPPQLLYYCGKCKKRYKQLDDFSLVEEEAMCERPLR